MAKITSMEALRSHYPPVIKRAMTKELSALDHHCRNYIAYSPFVVIGTQSTDGFGDVSPRGETPGFVKVLDDTTIAIPDRPGNNRLDTLSNILENPSVSLIFLIPGINETLRINGRAEIRDDEALMTPFEVNGNLPRTVLLVQVESAYMHCAKALMRSKLWQADTLIERSSLPTMSEWMIAHNSLKIEPESTKAMEERYKGQLY